MGPIEVGPVAPEVRHVETESYAIDLTGPPAVAATKEKIVVTVTFVTKGTLTLPPIKEWQIDTNVPLDVEVTAPVPMLVPPTRLKNTLQLQLNLIPLRAGLKHIAVHFAGQVCDADFCDVVTDEVSFNLDVK